MKDFQKSLEALDLSGCVLVIGLLCERALKIMAEDKKIESVKQALIV